MKKRLRNIILPLLLAFLLTACSKQHADPEPPARRTILIYMAANNSLGTIGSDTKDIEEITTAARNGLPRDCRLMLFHAPTDGSQTLYEVLPSGDLKTVRTYDGTRYTIASDFMLGVFRDARNAAPAADYGLILWSHALGWTQNGQIDNGPSLQTWGDDRGHTMNISTLSRVLSVYDWSWVYFDCCYMGCVEVAYQIAPYVNAMVASASEVPVDGMPYDLNLPLLFAADVDLARAAENTFNYYNTLSGEDRTCTISVLDLTHMNDLALATRPIYLNSTIFGPTDFPNLPLGLEARPLFYDFGVYVRQMAQANAIDPRLVDKWNVAYNAVVRYHAATPRLWNVINLENFTGTSTFIPRSSAEMSLRGYDTLDWYRDVASAITDKN